MRSKRIAACSVSWVGVLCFALAAQGAEELVNVDQVLTNPSRYHRHEVVLKGFLKLVGRTEGMDGFGWPTCGPVFHLDDGTGEMPVFYVIRCEQKEERAISAMAGEQVSVLATIDGETVFKMNDGTQYTIRAMAKTIRREER